MNKNKILFAAAIAFMCMPVIAGAQSEMVEKTNLYDYEIEEFVQNKDLASRIITSGGIDYSESYKIGWDKSNEVFGLEGMGLSFLNDALEVGAVNKISDACGDIGLGLAAIQLGMDIYSGNAGIGAMNFSKSSAFWSIGKFGWQSLKVAAIGVQFIDYAINKFGNAAVAARVGIWDSAFKNYYNNGPGKRNLTQWKNIFSQLSSSEAMESAIRSHLKTFWEIEDGLSYATVKTAALGFGDKWAADPLASEKNDIENSYMANLLLPYLKPLFHQMAKEAKNAQIAQVQAKYKSIVSVLNSRRNIRVSVLGPQQAISGLSIKIGDNFIEGVTGADGKVTFDFTVYGMLKHTVKSPVKAILTFKTEKGEQELAQMVDLKKVSSAVVFKIGGLTDVSGIITSQSDKKPIDGAKITIKTEKKTAVTNAAGEYLFRDIPDGDYQIEAEKKAFQKKLINFSLKSQGPVEGKNPMLTVNMELVPVLPELKILYPRNGELVEDLKPTIGAIIIGVDELEKSAISMKFDGQNVDFEYDRAASMVLYTPPAELKEDPLTKCKHAVDVYVELPGEPKKTLQANCAFTAGIRPVVTQIEFNEKFLKEPDKEPLIMASAFDKHSGPDPATIVGVLDGKTVKMEYGVVSDNIINIFYFPLKNTFRGGRHTFNLSLSDKAGIPSKPAFVDFRIPGPDIDLVRPVDAGKVLSGEAFSLALRIKNTGDGNAQNLAGTLYCDDRRYATVTVNRAIFGDLEPGMEAGGAPLYNIKTAANLGNPENGEPVYCNFTLMVYPQADPTQQWKEQFTIPIYPGEMTGGTVYVKLIHGTYMAGTWPVHTSNQTVCLNGTGGNFTAISDGGGNATFMNIPAGTYSAFVPTWYTYGAKLGEYSKTVEVIVGGEARATLKGSCPYLFVWTGKEYEKENDMYSTARILAPAESGALYIPSAEQVKKAEYTDYMYMQKRPVPVDNNYCLSLREIRNEISWTDFAQLLVVDHPKGTKISCDNKGNIYAYGQLIAPESARDNEGKDILKLVKQEDKSSFSAFNNSYIEVKFVSPQAIMNAKLVIKMRGWETVKIQGKPISGMQEVSIQTKDGVGQWQTRHIVYPRNEWDVAIVDMTPFFIIERTAEARICVKQCRTDKYHSIDFVGLDLSGQKEISVKMVNLKKAEHNSLGDVTMALSSQDETYVQTYPDEWIELSFDEAESAGKDKERDFIFVSKGHYIFLDNAAVVRIKR